MEMHPPNPSRDNLNNRDERMRRRLRPRPRTRPRRVRASTAAALSCSLVLVAGGSAALSSLGGLGLGLVSSFGVLAESSSGGGGGPQPADSGGGNQEATEQQQQQQQQKQRKAEILKPLVLDDFATVVHVTEPILQKEEQIQQKEEEEHLQQSIEENDGEDDARRAEASDDDASGDAADSEQPQQQPQQQPQPQQPKETTASEVLHDDSLSSIPPLPSDLIQLAEDSREHALEEKEMTRDALDSTLGEYDHKHGEEEALAEDKRGAEEVSDGPADDTQERPVDSGASDEASSELSEGAEQQDGTERPLGSELPVDDIDTAEEKPSGVASDQPADVDGTAPAAPSEPSDDSPKNRVVVDYASKAAGALVLEKSPNLKGTSNLLNNDNDKYAIAPCDEERKYVVIGLSEDILVKQIVLANYERYSSHPKEFQVLGSQTYPDATWIDLGTYTAQPGNQAQTFDLIDPTWARYLKLRFITHYGSEHY